jgi:hypothetical protein
MLRHLSVAISLLVALWSGHSAHAAIAFQGSGDLGNNNGSTDSLSGSYTVNAASNLLVVAVATLGADDVTGVTYDGVSLTKAVQNNAQTGGLERTALWFLVNPPTGSNTLAISRTSSAFILAVAADYSGAATTGQPDNTGVNQASASSVTSSLTMNTANSWIMAAACEASDTPAAGSGMTTRTATVTYSNPTNFDSNGPLAAGSQSFTIGSTGNSATAIVAAYASFAPAGGAAVMPGRTLLGVGQ